MPTKILRRGYLALSFDRLVESLAQAAPHTGRLDSRLLWSDQPQLVVMSGPGGIQAWVLPAFTVGTAEYGLQCGPTVHASAVSLSSAKGYTQDVDSVPFACSRYLTAN